MCLTQIRHNEKDNLKTEKQINKYVKQSWKDLKSLNIRESERDEGNTINDITYWYSVSSKTRERK